MQDLRNISSALLAWWDRDHADLPWRRTRDPYAIWVSEVMLQQTQIATVIPYFKRWMARFPTVSVLAEAELDEVLKLWEGLGYYSRARNLHAAARTVISEHDGRLPQTAAELMQLKGIGRYTAGAIASIAFAQPVPVLDGNVIRVLTRLADYAEEVTTAAAKRHLWQLAAELVPATRPGAYNQALMELGQLVCQPAKPLCLLCPVADSCRARERGTLLERPVKPPRKRTPHYDVVAGVIWQDGMRDAAAPFLIAQRPLDGLLGGLWEFPGGKQEPDETLPQALRREIREELDMDIEVGAFLTKIRHAYTHFRITLHTFHARHLHGEPQHLEVDDHRWVTLADLDQYAFAVTDRKIIAALQAELNEKPVP